MKKLILLFTISLFVTNTNAQVSQVRIEIDYMVYSLTNENHTAELCSYNYPPSGNFVIPETVEYEGNSYLVTRIGHSAVHSAPELLSVVMPNSIIEIDENAFYGCTKLASVQLSDHLISIGPFAFYGCRALTSIEFPTSLTTIECYAFTLTGLTTIFVPKSLTKISPPIDKRAMNRSDFHNWFLICSPFYNCTNLSSIIVEEGNPIYDSRDNCNAIIETATNTILCGCKNSTIPYSVTAIWPAAFSNCELSSITIPDGVTSIERETFYNCTNLTEITIPNSVTSIGDVAFAGCTNLTEITIPNSVTSIGDLAFESCKSLSSLQIGENVKEIGSGAFHNCTSLSYLSLPDGLVSIGVWAFESCSNLTEVIFNEGLASIGNYAFDYCDNYINVILPSTVTSIGHYAFRGNKDKTVTCYAETIPLVDEKAFFNDTTKKTFATTLTVPDVALQEYARTCPWNEFGTIMSFSGEIAEPVLGIVPATASVDANSYEIARYAIDGRRLYQPQRGLNIIKLSNGMVKKVMVK